jgi:rRNA maturation protein Nop10
MSDIAKCPACKAYIDVTFTIEKCPKCGLALQSVSLKPAVFESRSASPFPIIFNIFVNLSVIVIVGLTCSGLYDDGRPNMNTLYGILLLIIFFPLSHFVSKFLKRIFGEDS